MADAYRTPRRDGDKLDDFDSSFGAHGKTGLGFEVRSDCSRDAMMDAMMGKHYFAPVPPHLSPPLPPPSPPNTSTDR